MSLLNSKFDIQSVDNPLAVAALAQVLSVNNPPALGTNGTPQPGTIPPGAIVVMNNPTDGTAILAATAPAYTANTPVLAFVTIDGNMDFSGSFVEKITVFAGGFTMVTDQWASTNGAFVPGAPVTFAAGKIVAMPSPATQLIGFVGPAGYDSVAGTVQIIVPQGAGF